MTLTSGVRHDWRGSPVTVGLAVAAAAMGASVLAHLLLAGPAVALVGIGAAAVVAGYSTSGSV
ncbi:hypothetical protein [Nonomuraea gerenzanensis]|uniref:hypothetical protein n=1 Tax=Nonomuraea gerenzanensis TaxID=93944 RepID=UPI001CD99B98|nr:hypothetical protein [Nonomuraea gerenzanensis]UBU16238.1 hypothetical protein LCN96_14850 [Nonomuraea gerenzanensis]